MFLSNTFLETDLAYVFRYYDYLIFLETISHISSDVVYYHDVPEYEKEISSRAFFNLVFLFILFFSGRRVMEDWNYIYNYYFEKKHNWCLHTMRSICSIHSNEYRNMIKVLLTWPVV